MEPSLERAEVKENTPESAHSSHHEKSAISASEGRGDTEEATTNVETAVELKSPDAAPPSEATIGPRLVFTICGLCLSVFCVALDTTIISTAIPTITNQFHALQDVGFGWYGSAYLLTTCAFQLFFGKLYFLFSIKFIFLSALFLFELGSLICGVAPSSIALIVGRAIAGLGAAGIFSGALIIIANITPLEKRAAYQGMLGGMYGIASVVGPLIGGAFTDNVTWRWCFYINLPIGGVTAAAVVLALRLPPASMFKNLGFRKSAWQLDPVGTVLFVPSIICLLLALKWGGTTYAWSTGRIIALLVIFAVTIMSFVGVQGWMKDSGTVPPRIALQRTVASSSVFAFFLGGAFFLLIYFLPIWFQAVKGTDALQSGIDTIPLILSNTFGIIFSGSLTTKFGYYMPYVYLCVVLTSVASGLLMTLEVSSSTGRWVGYQILYGFGCGCAFQLPQIAAQAVLAPPDVPIGVAVTLFATMLGGSIFVSAANNVLNNGLIKYIGNLNIPGVDPHNIVNIGATQFRSYIPQQYLPQAVEAYNTAVSETFRIALIISCLSAVGAAGMQWKSLKQGGTS